MNTKLHLNACYQMALHCGLTDNQAFVVANSCLAVDESTERGEVRKIVPHWKGEYRKVTNVEKTVTAYNTEELWKAVCNSTTTRDKILCFHFNNCPVDFLYGKAREAYLDCDYFALGFWLHTIMDHYSHSHFTRHPSKINNVELMVYGESKVKHWLLNRVRGLWVEPIGHAEALGYPDDFDAKWSFNGGQFYIDNSELFTRCFNRIIREIFKGGSINQIVLKGWTTAVPRKHVGFILRHHEWHTAARKARKFILSNELR